MIHKSLIWLNQLITIGLFLILPVSCNKDEDNKSSTVTDIEGNIYHTVKIGSQVWMVENLKTTRYNDGTEIPLVTDSVVWNNLSTPAYCWMNNNSANKETYGALYNWYAVNTGKLCPEGWHVPTNEEWQTLIEYLGGINVAGSELKESGLTHWTAPNEGACNCSGFTALPGGCRVTEEIVFNYFLFASYWWTSTEEDPGNAWWWSVNYVSTSVVGYFLSMDYGFSVRCIKD